MDLDPHTLQAILQKIYQQMRCPQCGKKVPVDFSAVRVCAGDSILLQLKCDDCDAHIVLQASLQGIENITAPPYERDSLSNASTTLDLSKEEVQILRNAIEESGGSFQKLFKKNDAEADQSTSGGQAI